MADDIVLRDELQAAIEARKELGAEIVPLFAIAASFTGLAGVLAVCAALSVIAIVSARAS
jgi:hypothetical protein